MGGHRLQKRKDRNKGDRAATSGETGSVGQSHKGFSCKHSKTHRKWLKRVAGHASQLIGGGGPAWGWWQATQSSLEGSLAAPWSHALHLEGQGMQELRMM